MGMPDINPILAAASNTSSLVGRNSDQQVDIRNSQADIANVESSLQLDIGLNNNIINGAKNSAALATQNARVKAGAIFGADLNQQGEKISENVAIWEAAYQQKMAAAQRIQQKDSVQFMDNPLGFIINQFSVNDDIRAHNSALEVEQDARQHVEEINQLSNQTAVNQKNFEAGLTQAAIDAEAKNTLNAAQIAAGKAQKEGLGYNVEALQISINASKEQTALKFQVLGAQNAQAQLGLAMQSYALHKQEFDWKKEEKAKASESDDYFVDRIQAGLKVMYGDKAPDLGSAPKLGRQMLMLLKSGGPAGKEALDAYMAGQSGILGGSPAQVIDSMRSGVAFQFTPTQEPIKKIFDIAVQEVSKGVAAGSITKTNYQEVMNQQVIGQVNKYLKDINPGDGTNPFNIGSTAALVGMPAVASTPLAQKILAPAIATGAKFDDPKQVWATALDGVNKGTISISEAVDGITTLYQKGVDTNLASRELTKFGIVPTDNMHSYNTRLETKPSALFGGTEIVDLTKPQDVKRAVLKTLSSQRITNTVFAPGGTDPTSIN